MFIHTVLFEIKPKEVPDYRRDCRMWVKQAGECKGFLGYFTMRRLGVDNQFASVYKWKTKKDHDCFMKKFHDLLVAKSKAKVKVLGYYNLNSVDIIP